MRTLTLTLTLKPEDGAFDALIGDQLHQVIYDGILRAFPLLRESELGLEVIADAYEPTVPR